jgi:FdhE protein
VKKAEAATSRLEKIIDSAILNYPHSRNIIEAFKPVLLEKLRLSGTLNTREGSSLVLDEAKFKQGLSLGDQNIFFFPDDPWKELSLALIPAIARGFPSMAADLEKLKGLISSGKIDFSGNFEERLQEWSSDHEIDPGIFGFLVHMAERVILEARAHQWARLIEGFQWDKGYCPICGSAPMIAKVEDGIARRWLQCSECRHEWTFSRVVCPSCGNTRQKEMNYFTVEKRETESTFVCEQCRRYLVTVSKVSDLKDFDAEVAALSLVHLDVVMQGKGYLPMASCEWNRLSE